MELVDQSARRSGGHTVVGRPVELVAKGPRGLAQRAQVDSPQCLLVASEPRCLFGSGGGGHGPIEQVHAVVFPCAHTTQPFERRAALLWPPRRAGQSSEQSPTRPSPESRLISVQSKASSCNPEQTNESEGHLSRPAVRRDLISPHRSTVNHSSGSVSASGLGGTGSRGSLAGP